MRIQILITFLIISINYVCAENEGRSSILADAVDEYLSTRVSRSTANYILERDGDSFQTTYEVKDFLDEFLKKKFTIPKIGIRIETFAVPTERKRVFRIFIVSSYEGLTRIFNERSLKDILLNGHFLIILPKCENHDFEKFFDFLWNLRIVNVNIICAKTNQSVSVFSFMPFTQNNCRDTKPILINQYQNGKFIKPSNFFDPLKIKDMKGCPVRVALTNSSEAVFYTSMEKNKNKICGPDIKLISTLSKALNFKLNFTFIGHSGFLFENGTSEGPFRVLLDENADLAVGYWWLKTVRMKFFSSTVSYAQQPLIFIIPPGKPVTHLERLISAFSLQSWICIGLFYLIGSLVILFVQLKSPCVQEFVFGAGVTSPMFRMFSVFIGDTLNNLPKRNFARFLLMNFIIFTLIIRTVYQGSYFRQMRTFRHHKEVASINEMIEKYFYFYSNPGMIDILLGLPAIRERVRELNNEDLPEFLKQITTNPNFKAAYANALLFTDYLNLKNSDESQHICKEVFATNLPVVIYSLTDFYLLNALDEKLITIIKAGLIDHWTRESCRQNVRKVQESIKPKVLTFDDLEGSFLVLIFGCLLGFIAFLCEKFLL
ncbi:CLUMA_CG003833, isoform A [Clunio marinus]|uniref:CLUMA_CG003833, isoform A n=1 Tax=Clunio marinus TaxID=568069 RepID=A0A1J1HQ59_9DIPT|nr:CLUMA_CG003833, isoform A [Clunio marinus]